MTALLRSVSTLIPHSLDIFTQSKRKNILQLRQGTAALLFSLGRLLFGPNKLLELETTRQPATATRTEFKETRYRGILLSQTRRCCATASTGIGRRSEREEQWVESSGEERDGREEEEQQKRLAMEFHEEGEYRPNTVTARDLLK